MKNKYYIPEIEDLRVGYEVEKAILRLKPQHTSDNETYIEGWEKFIVDEDQMQFISMLIRGGGGEDHIRVPYLTKEQIEAEGWKKEGIFMLYNVLSLERSSDEIMSERFTKNNFNMFYYYKEKLLTIIMKRANKEDVSIFGGECKDINTFRWLCKLLKI